MTLQHLLHMTANEWSAIAAIASVVTAFATVVLFCVGLGQLRSSRLTQSADIVMRLERQFENTLRVDRGITGEALKESLNVLDTDEHRSIETVFEFFETVGLLVRRGVVDDNLVYNNFFFHLHGYWRFGREFVTSEQTKYPKRYVEFSGLHDRLLRLEGGRSALVESEWDSFLDEEERLLEGADR